MSLGGYPDGVSSIVTACSWIFKPSGPPTHVSSNSHGQNQVFPHRQFKRFVVFDRNAFVF